MIIRVALATANPGKVREIARILGGSGVELVGPPPGWVPPPEDDGTYLGNALAKARALVGATGMPCVADDSGIEVDALGGAPGPRSARYAGRGATDDENLRKLIGAVAGVPEGGRTARYRCVAVLVSPRGEESSAEGAVEGRLILRPRGTGGFGYDPIFVPEGGTGTMAELAPEEKDAISHRGKAFGGLVAALRALGS